MSAVKDKVVAKLHSAEGEVLAEVKGVEVKVGAWAAGHLALVAAIAAVVGFLIGLWL